MVADYAFLREHKRVTRRSPEKGFVRLLLIGGWMVAHLYVLVVLAFYHAYRLNPVHAFWWFWSTSFAGCMYVSLCYSNPGFINKETLLRLTSNLDLGVDVVGSDIARGLLPEIDSVAAPSKSTQPLKAIDEVASASASDDDEFAPTEADGAPLGAYSSSSAEHGSDPEHKPRTECEMKAMTPMPECGQSPVITTDASQVIVTIDTKHSNAAGTSPEVPFKVIPSAASHTSTLLPSIPDPRVMTDLLALL